MDYFFWLNMCIIEYLTPVILVGVVLELIVKCLIMAICGETTIPHMFAHFPRGEFMFHKRKLKNDVPINEYNKNPEFYEQWYNPKEWAERRHKGDIDI